MKVILFLFLWILFFLFITEVYGEDERAVYRFKRNHEPCDEENSTESPLSTETSDVEPFDATYENENIKSISSDVQLKKARRRRKNKKVIDKKLDSLVLHNTAVENLAEKNSNIIEISNDIDDEKTQLESLKDNVFSTTINTDLEGKPQSEEVIIPYFKNKTNQFNEIPNAVIDSDISNKTIELNKEPNNNIENYESNRLKEILSDEVETKIGKDNETSVESNDETVLSDFFGGCKESVPLINVITNSDNNLNLNVTENENNNCNPINLDKELQKNIEPLSKQSGDNKYNLSPSFKSYDTQIPLQKDNIDFESTISISDGKKDFSNDNEYLDILKQGPALTYEQEDLQHYIHRYYLYPLNKQLQPSAYNRLVFNEQTPSTASDFQNTAFPQNTNDYNSSPYYGYIDDYKVEDSYGHEITYAKDEDCNKFSNVMNNNQNTNNLWKFNNIIRQSDKKCIKNSLDRGNYIHYDKITNDPYNIINRNIYYDSRTSYAHNNNKKNNAYINNYNELNGKVDEISNLNRNILYPTNPYYCEKHKTKSSKDVIYPSDDTFNPNKALNSNENYAKINRNVIKTPNALIIKDNIDKKISQNINTKDFHGVEENIWKSWNNRKLTISDCYQNKIN